MKAAVLISANTEWKAVKGHLEPHALSSTPYGESFRVRLASREIDFTHSGWGKAASAGALQYLLDHQGPDLVVNLGTCGGWGERVAVGEIILAERTFMYDIVDLMGDVDSVPEFYASHLDLSWLPAPPHPVRRGAIASADSDLPPDKVPFLVSQGALGADWESAALAWVAVRNRARLLILRGVSDLVSSEGGEAYGDIQLYKDRTGNIMRALVDQLPDWLEAVEKAL